MKTEVTVIINPTYIPNYADMGQRMFTKYSLNNIPAWNCFRICTQHQNALNFMVAGHYWTLIAKRITVQWEMAGNDSNLGSEVTEMIRSNRDYFQMAKDPCVNFQVLYL
jgi:hypothetical protein